MSLSQTVLRPWVRFCTDRRGAFAISFVMMSGFLLGMAAFGVEGSRYIPLVNFLWLRWPRVSP